MNERDWRNWQSEWDDVDDVRPDIEEPVKSGIPELKVVHSDTDSNTYAYLKTEGKGTAKAEFYLISDGDKRYGFWCPRSAILNIKSNGVQIASWCKLTVIEYIWS